MDKIKEMEEPTSEVAVIAKGTTIRGNIQSKGHLDVDGDVDGSISVLGNVRIAGDVSGDVECNGLMLRQGALRSGVRARADVSVLPQTRIEGDIECGKINIEGSVKGNIKASELVQAVATAEIEGDIVTDILSVSPGAMISGRITAGKK